MPVSRSYNPRACCNTDCFAIDCSDEQPCWGNVEVIDEEYDEFDLWWIHGCQGHKDCSGYRLERYVEEAT